MKRISCPQCNTKIKVLSAGNTDGARCVVSKADRKGGGEQLRKITNGSRYQMVLSCRCKGGLTFTVIGRSRADAITRLRRLRERRRQAA